MRDLARESLEVRSEYFRSEVTMLRCALVLSVLLLLLAAVEARLPVGVKCGPGRFDCGDGRCILQRSVCDGINSCDNKSDEKNCGKCSIDGFRCGTRCADEGSRCDGYRNCNDGVDEENCGTIDPAKIFTCDDGQTVRSDLLCDGIQDCSDTSDERNCTSCTRDGVFCDNTCKGKHIRCDGFYDCNSGIDEANCTHAPTILIHTLNVKCRKDQLDCGNNQCVHKKYRCDGSNDCQNRFDESNCTECSPKAFMCDGYCRRETYRCDGKQDCTDGADEADCPEINPLYLFICDTGTTRLNTSRCDGRVNCPNEDDEDNCRPEMCIDGSFFCDGYCRFGSKLCNGIRDCSNGEDEIHCPGFQSEVDLNRACGRAGTGPAALTTNGQKAELGAFPWHAGIYRLKNEHDCDDYEYICGASLITTDTLVTAAHCFYKGTQRLTEDHFAVAVGKIYSDWNADELGEYHKSQVKHIHIYPVYRGLRRKYADDIALVVMEKPAILGKHIATVCLDPAIKLNQNDLIQVVGWGNGSTALQELESVSLPYNPFESCVDLLENNPTEISFLTYDKFCSPLQNWIFRSPGLAQGDSGGGAVVRRGGSWSLVGVVSVSLNQGKIFGFTNVTAHSSWIARNVPGVGNTKPIQN